MTTGRYRDQGIKKVKKRVLHKADAERSRSVAAPDTLGIQDNLPFSVFIILLISFIAYFNSIYGDFVFDDTTVILNNPWIRDIKHIPAIFSSNLWAFIGEREASNYYRPLVHIFYICVYYIFGLKPWGFHLVNVIFNCGVSVLVFLVIRRLLLKHGTIEPKALITPSLLAALLFASHPIHTEAVAWISALPDLSFAFFFLLSFYLYTGSTGNLSAGYLSSVVFFALSSLCKEPALTLPLILMAYDYVFGESKTRYLSYARRYAPYFIISAVYIAVRLHVLGGFVPNKRFESLDYYQAAINVFPLFMQYLKKLLLPINLNVYYVFHPITSLLELTGAASFMGSLVFVMLLIAAFRKNRLAFFALLFMTVPLLPALYIPALGETAFAERYLYLPSAGFALVLAVFLSAARRQLPKAFKGIALLTIAITVLYTAGTINRNAVWKDGITLWTDTVRKSPESVSVHNNLGIAYESKGLWDMAIEQYQTAIRLNPSYEKAYNNLGISYAYKGQWDLAIEQYQTAIRLNPDNADAYNNLGIAYKSKGLWDTAIAQYQTAIRLNPAYEKAYNNLGISYASKEQWDLAIEQYQTAISLNPDNADAHNNLGIAYTSKGQWDMAIEQFRIALRLNPDHAEAHYALAVVYLKKGNIAEGQRELNLALSIKPDLFLKAVNTGH